MGATRDLTSLFFKFRAEAKKSTVIFPSESKTIIPTSLSQEQTHIRLNRDGLSKKLESKDPIEVIPKSLVDIIPSGVGELIYEYSDASLEWITQLKSTMFGVSSVYKRILVLAEHAGSFTEIETLIRAAASDRARLPLLQATLRQAIKLAVIGMDLTIRDKNDNEIDKGMAERLWELHTQLFPGTDRKL